jgi:haloalkane dehalogenase
MKSKPTMLISGDKDFGIAPDHAVSDFRGLFPDASIVEVSGVGHFCQEDIPEELVQFIIEFIAKYP